MTETELDREAIYREYHGKLLGYIEARLGNREDAEDLCAEVFVKVLAKLPDFDAKKASLSTWIYTIARNAVIDFYRTRRVLPEIPETCPSAEDLEASGIRKETLRELAEALSKLPEEQRDVVVLHYYQDLTLQEIAVRMGLSYGVTKLRHKDALRRLAQLMGRE